MKVQNPDGTYIKVQNGDMAEESEENEDEIIRKVKGDQVFELITRRGASRLAMVILAYVRRTKSHQRFCTANKL